jgi:Na+-translocating ferredoxin:NAD+ oxidoreductase RnfG subunit
MIKKFIIVTILFLIFFSGEIRDKTELYLQKYFGKDILFSVEKINIPHKLKIELEKKSQQKFYTDFVYLYKLKENNKIIAYAVLDNVMGKVQPITFLLIYNLDLKIIDFQIIKYREEHGYEVENESWRKQFLGKSKDSKFLLNDDIDGITGATISVKSLIKGVYKATLLTEKLFENE